MLVLSTHFILFILAISTDTTMRFSCSLIISDCVTLVPPPYGTRTTLCLFARVTKFSTC
jgi:hypothetical protein